MYSFNYMKLVQNLVQKANVSRLWHHFFHSGSRKGQMHSLKFVSKGSIKKAMKGDQNIEFLKKQFSEAVILL